MIQGAVNLHKYLVMCKFSSQWKWMIHELSWQRILQMASSEHFNKQPQCFMIDIYWFSEI